MNEGSAIREPKIPLPIFIFGLQYIFLTDLADLIPIVSEIGVTDLLGSGPMMLYLTMTGAPILIGAVGTIAEIVLGAFSIGIISADDLPIRTLAWILTFVVDRAAVYAGTATGMVGGEALGAKVTGAIDIGAANVSAATSVAKGRIAGGASTEAAAAEEAAATEGVTVAGTETAASGAAAGEAGKDLGSASGAGIKVSPEALGEQKEPLEKLKELMEKPAEPEARKESPEEEMSSSDKELLDKRGENLKITPEDMGERGLEKSGDALKITPEDMGGRRDNPRITPGERSERSNVRLNDDNNEIDLRNAAA